MRRHVLLLSIVLLAASALTAQRQPVLKQIGVPHPYYFREMYLPQLTTGPSAAAWSPDGTRLVFSMAGSLWVQPADGTEAQQLTASGGYDHQPDWSPDGRTIVFVRYAGDALSLHAVDVASGRTAPLLENGAVNVEPRWSPDGSKLAFVSTMFNDRWHVFVGEVKDGRLAAPQRITEDKESGLPRYYYSRFDHYLSPSWSPDGRELLLVSNRGRIMGTGGAWRVEARPGAPMREVHYEETTWKMRPDWSRDGRRVVYSSYAGRQWHQLWLMTAEGGDVFPLTYGEFDATNPRWSADGKRIAYISNESGNTALWIVDVPGGRRRPLEIRTRKYREPMGRVRIRVTEGGAARPARVSVTAADGRAFAPHDAWMHADDAFVRGERPFEQHYFHVDGTAELDVPAGRVVIQVVRGLQSRPVRREVTVAPGSEQQVDVALERIAALERDGWLSGDLHVHMNYGGTYRNTPRRLVQQARAEDLDFVENLIVNKEQRIPDVEYFSGKPDSASADGVTLTHGQEFHTSYWGHTALLGLTQHLLLPDYAAYVNTAAASLYPHNAAVSDMARAQGALLGYVHPYDAEPVPTDLKAKLTDELPIDAALGKVDYMEIVGFSDHQATANIWYRLLNVGLRIPAGAGTDAMANFASLRGPVGMNRVFVRTKGDRSRAAWLAGLKAGRTFATNGPLLTFSVNGHEPGDVSDAPRGTQLRLRGTLSSIVPIDHLEVVSNGKVYAEIPLTGDRTSATFDLDIPSRQSAWYTLRARNVKSHPLVLDGYAFATTSPVYVLADGKPIASPEDAAFFLAWIDRVEASVLQHKDWNTDGERSAVMASIAQAREFYRAQTDR